MCSNFKAKIIKAPDIEFINGLTISDFPLAVPSETVYGLAAPLSDIISLKKVYELKNRPATNPLIIHISSLTQLSKIIKAPPKPYENIMKKFWPGPLTFIFEAKTEFVKSNAYLKKFFQKQLENSSTIKLAIRMPANECFLRLIDKFGPICAPSCNISGRPSTTTAEDVYEDFKNTKMYILDDNQSIFGLESSIINFNNNRIEILRKGSLSEESILKADKESQLKELKGLFEQKFLKEKKAEILKEIEKFEFTEQINCEEGRFVCPGTKFKHYSPRCPFITFESISELESLISESKNCQKIGVLVDFLFYDTLTVFNEKSQNFIEKAEMEKFLTGKNQTKVSILNLGKNNSEIARNFYNYVRFLEKHCDIIYCIKIKDFSNEGAALDDRILRASL